MTETPHGGGASVLEDEHTDDPPDESDVNTRTDGPKRGRSTIRFPYTDIRDAIAVAHTLKNHFGSQASLSQMAAAMGSTLKSGAFRNKLTAATMFGAITSKKGLVTLTPLGHELADQHTQADALVKAFMNVPLYKELYDEFDGRALPEGPGLEARIKAKGVVDSQSDRARQAFLRSAEHAGLFWGGRDRLVIPPSARVDDNDGCEGNDSNVDADLTDSKGARLNENQLLKGLWSMLPTEGSFDTSERRRWLRALALNLDLVYGETDLIVQVDLPPQGPAAPGSLSGVGHPQAGGS